MRTSWLVVALVVGCASTVVAQQTAPDGEQIYQRACARCHDTSLTVLFASGPIRDYPAERVYESLSAGLMVGQATGLNTAEKRAVAEYVSGGPSGSLAAPLDQIPTAAYCGVSAATRSDPYAGPSWNGWGPDRDNARFQSVEAAGLTADEVSDLSLKWAFGFPGVTVASFQATIVGGRVLVGSGVGVVYALDADTGCIHWAHETEAGVRATVTVGAGPGGRATAFFGDLTGNAYAVDFETGELRWTVEVDDHAHARITGAPTLYDGRLFVPVASLEEVAAQAPAYPCCTFRGSVAALDAATGRRLWQHYPIDEAPARTGTNSAGAAQWGPSGVGIWASPTVDPERNRVYVATGDSYSNPVSPLSDAIVALAMDTGELLWVSQTTPGDAWVGACLAPDESGRANCPEDAGPDHDFGSAIVMAEVGGRSLLLAGQKSGVLYGMDPDTGEIVWETRISQGGVLGGIEWGFASDGETVFASISDALEKAPGEAGGMAAVGIASGDVVWEAPPFQDTCGTRPGCHTAQPGAVTAMPGVVFSGSLDGHIRAYAADTGDVIWDVDTVREYRTVNGVPGRGGSLNGPGATIAGGMVFVSSGYGLANFMPGNVLLAFSVDGQ